jgi:cell shape-determining protein MreC
MTDSSDRISVIQSQVHDLIEKYRLAVVELEQQAQVLEESTNTAKELQQRVSSLRSENEELRLMLTFNGDAAARANLVKRLQAWSREINQAINKIPQ